MEQTIWVMGIVFLATLVRSSFGFGEALVAVPLLAFLLPMEVAAPIVSLISVTAAAVVLLQDWSQVHFPSARRLFLATLFGIPLGILLLTSVSEPVVKGVLAIIIIAFSGYSLTRPQRRQLYGDRAAWLFGFLAGILGGAYGMNGPPLVLYGALRGWSPAEFRATLQGYYLPTSIVILIGYRLVGLWSPDITHLYLLSLPAMIVAILSGRALNRRMTASHFLRYVHIGLILIAVMLLAQAAGLLRAPAASSF